MTAAAADAQVAAVTVMGGQEAGRMEWATRVERMGSMEEEMALREREVVLVMVRRAVTAVSWAAGMKVAAEAAAKAA